MRDVTDNVTADLPGVEQKRGRGRPRTGHAKSNAERQAAYRARRQAERAADRSVTVTKKLANVDAYDECRLEVEQLRVELLAKQEQVGMLIDYQEELAAELVGVRRQVEMAEAERSKAFAENRRLKEQLADAQKSVTPSNGYSSVVVALTDIVRLACAPKRSKYWRSELLESEACRRLNENLSFPQVACDALIAAIQGGKV